MRTVLNEGVATAIRHIDDVNGNENSATRLNVEMNHCCIDDLIARVDCNITRSITPSGNLGSVTGHEEVGYPWSIDCARCGSDFSGNDPVADALGHLQVSKGVRHV